MTTTTPDHTPAGSGDALLALMAVAVLVCSGAVAALGVFQSWVLLPVALVTLIAAAVAVAVALGRLMAD